MASRYTILAPARGYTGEVAGVAFVKGRAENAAPSRRALAYFRRHNYTVEEVTSAPDPAPPVDKPALPAVPNRGSSKADWVTYVTSDAAPEDKRLGEAEATAMTRDQLAEHVFGPKTEEGADQ